MRGAFSAERSFAFLARASAPVESTMTTWAVIALLLVLVMIAVGGPL